MLTNDEHEAVVKQAGEFENHVDNLCSRLIEAENRAESLQTTVHLQEAEIERLNKRLSNAERQRDDTMRDLRLFSEAMLKIASTVRETNAQRLQAPPQAAVQVLTGAPMDPASLKVVRATAIANAAREQSQTGSAAG